jgi:hypothetical protein
MDKDNELYEEINRTRVLSKHLDNCDVENETDWLTSANILAERLIHKLKQTPVIRSLDEGDVKEVHSIDKITKGLLWQ